MFQISLRAARVNSGKTQRDVAASLGISKNTVINWESGKVSPRVEDLRRLCELYAVPLDYIFLPSRFAESETA